MFALQSGQDLLFRNFTACGLAINKQLLVRFEVCLEVSYFFENTFSQCFRHRAGCCKQAVLHFAASITQIKLLKRFNSAG